MHVIPANTYTVLKFTKEVMLHGLTCLKIPGENTVYVCTCKCMYEHAHVRMYEHAHVCTNMLMYICTNMLMYVRTCSCMYEHAHVRMYEYAHVCMYCI